MEGTAAVGGHITLLFSVQDDASDPMQQGSRGAGLSLAHGVKVRVQAKPRAGAEATVEGGALQACVLRTLASGLPEVGAYDWVVDQESELPPSQGFGLSAAGAIACALAMQRALGIPDAEARPRAIEVAHRVERELSGGLGDVAGLAAGGVECRLEPGCPGEVVSFAAEVPVVLCWRLTASQHTSGYIDHPDWKVAIRDAGEASVARLREGTWEPARWSDLLEESTSFAETSGLLEDANRTDLLAQVGEVTSEGELRLCMLGESVVVLPSRLDEPLEDAEALVARLQELGLGTRVSSISTSPIR